MAKKGKKKPSKKAKKKAPRKAKKSALRKVASKDYSICWDPGQDQAYFGHKSGVGGAIGSGLCDTIRVFSKGNRLYVLSVNYMRQYAALESFADETGVQQALIAGPKDLKNLFGEDLAEHPPKEIAERLAVKMD